MGAVATVVVAAGGITVAVAASSDGSSATSVPSTKSADAGFARDMATHHQQAVEMSYIVRDRTKDEEIRRLAYDIAQTQANQRGMLLGWLDLWELPKVPEGAPMEWMGMGDVPPGKDGALMPGMATNTELKGLGKLSGRAAEVRYLQLMTEHHKGGVHMAAGCVERCEVGAEVRLARGMVASQESEIELMAGLLKARGAKA
ncbi:DUF305 domain-containing protein [Streptomyces sp. NPDC048441]|uniref:DUF305 domain-containing protein n=1 Tax=Streptomyces sp. NPDC048441 TaxID=3365552 RepID=UPI003711ED7D